MMKIHSMIDAITNSSAEVYVFLNDNAETESQRFDLHNCKIY